MDASSSDTNDFFRVPASIVRVSGKDAIKIVNNLTTADLTLLQPGTSAEAFVTEVRGRTLGHVTIRRDGDDLTMVGASGQSESIAAHVDRYTIREDAVAEIIDPPTGVLAGALASPGSNAAAEDGSASRLHTPWLGHGTIVIFGQELNSDRPEDSIAAERLRDESAFHDARIHAGFPWWGVDFDASNLPQEVNRDSAAISFTKGCYLGQETVARLDALGQVQKKLVRLSITKGSAKPNDKIMVDGKPVARITSVTADGSIAFAMVRRQWFDPGSDAVGTNDGNEFVATVLA